jgi:hypothetical protein
MPMPNGNQANNQQQFQQQQQQQNKPNYNFANNQNYDDQGKDYTNYNSQNQLKTSSKLSLKKKSLANKSFYFFLTIIHFY